MGHSLLGPAVPRLGSVRGCSPSQACSSPAAKLSRKLFGSLLLLGEGNANGICEGCPTNICSLLLSSTGIPKTTSPFKVSFLLHKP